MRIAILANCQADPLASVLRLALPRAEVLPVVVNTLRGPEAQESGLAAVLECDVVVSQHLGADFGVLSTEHLTAAFPSTLLIPNVFYLGFHPDIAYVGPGATRLQGPTGDYHSAVVLQAFKDGLTVDACVGDFDRLLEETAPPREVMERSREELAGRAQAIGFPADELVSRVTERGLSMYTMNHPMTDVFVWLGQWIVRRIGQRSEVSWPWLRQVVDNPLSRNIAWPVAPEAARLHGIPVVGERVFRGARGVVHDLRSFVTASYAAYDEAAPEALVLRRPDLRRAKP